MKRKLLVKCINSSGLFIVFFTIFLLFSSLTYHVLCTKQALIYRNSFFSDNSIDAYLLLPANVTDSQKVLDTIENEKGIVLGADFQFNPESDKKLLIKTLYFNEKPINEPPIISGRFLNVKDFTEKKCVCTAGRNILKYAKKIGNKSYIEYDNIDFEVIGIMGYKGHSSFYDNWAVINYDYYISSTRNFTSFKIDSTKDIETSLNNINDNLKKINKGLLINRDNIAAYSNSKAMLNALFYSKRTIEMYFFIMAVLFINIINASFFWIQKKRKEIGIRKAFGATSGSIVRQTFLEFETITFFSAVVSLLCQILIDKFAPEAALSENIYISSTMYFETFILLVMFAMIIGAVSSFIPLRYILNQQSNDIIRER